MCHDVKEIEGYYSNQTYKTKNANYNEGKDMKGRRNLGKGHSLSVTKTNLILSV